MQMDRSACDLVEVIVTLAHKLKLQVIAEGVESVRQFERLRDLGCELAQGFYFSQPLEARAVPEFMLRQSAARGAGTS
jgi:EAL domain-containing protein (putative c-di-GMP-specific phosphodiesterase class I)